MTDLPSGEGQYVPYPRVSPEEVLGADYLAALGVAYRDINRLSAVGFALFLIACACTVNEALDLLGRLVLFICPFVFGFLTFNVLRRIGYRGRWKVFRVASAAIIMALNWILLGGILELAVIQQLLTDEMKKLGVRSGFTGPTQKEIDRAIAALREQDVDACANGATHISLAA